MLELSNTRASTARMCWMRYKWRYVDGLEPAVKPVALTLGAIMHEAFDGYYKGLDVPTITRYIETRFDEELSKVPYPDQDRLVIAKHTARGMWAGYPYKDKKEFESIDSEVEIRMPLQPGVVFTGRIDGKVKKDGVYWCRELKTSSLSQRQFEERCKVSSQASGYTSALIAEGVDCKGVMYDYIKKPLLQQRKTETSEQFGQRIYQDYRDTKRHGLYYGRHYAYRNQHELDAWREGMEQIAEDIYSRTNNNRWYRNYDACFPFGGACPFFKICHAPKPDSLTLQLYYTTREQREKEVKK